MDINKSMTLYVFIKVLKKDSIRSIVYFTLSKDYACLNIPLRNKLRLDFHEIASAGHSGEKKPEIDKANYTTERRSKIMFLSTSKARLFAKIHTHGIQSHSNLSSP